MQRWFYANEELVCDHQQEASLPAAEVRVTETEIIPPKMSTWRFCVNVKNRELMPNEALALSGNCTQLGNWQFEQCVLMTPINENCQKKWHVYVDLPAEAIVNYRYLIVAIDSEGQQMIVRFFESHLKTRKVRPQSECIVEVCEDVFGLVKCATKVERGWLTTEKILQLMFFKAPFKWQANTLNEHEMLIKVTPLYRKDMGDCLQSDDRASEPLQLTNEIDERNEEDIDLIEDDKKLEKSTNEIPYKCVKAMPSYTELKIADCSKLLNLDEDKNIEASKDSCGDAHEQAMPPNQLNTTLSTAFAFNEVVNVNENKESLKRQPNYGSRCGKKDLTIFHLTIGDFQNTVYLIEFFTHSKNAAHDEKPYLVGYRYLLPEDFGTSSQGYIEAPIVCASTHRLLGNMKFRFLIIRPVPDLKFDLSISYLRHWDTRQESLDVGHRGQGVSYITADNKILYENTIYSMQQAVKNGADMIEFDVHLTKDAVPVVHHDFNVHVSQLDPQVIQDFNNFNLPISKLSYRELQNLKLPSSVIYPQALLVNKRIGDAAEPEQLFPLLSDVMVAVDETVAFDIEIKWPQQYCNGKWEEGVKPHFDRNTYLDHILKVIMEKANNRQIVLSCFEVDLCSMLRFKQNRFPVMLLLPPEYSKPYLDARSNSCTTGNNISYAMEFLGIIPPADVLLRCPSLIGESHALNLIVFCYGIHDKEDISELKNIGVSAVILDRIDKLKKKEECDCACCTPVENGGADLKAAGDKISFKSLESWNEYNR